ncbi:transposase [Mesorhizobium sp. ESP7-2]|uniref:transposase n=1 Tax=Mesorhizobium sp. ESP7-2 TaxID=2876622 RepID=UPI001CCB53A6|nr:transposase [Mesorhizobium sp. ESP7-2]MBZ9711136.1 transposase [Mesorhizobium sp. ESP7-2]
MRQQTRPFIVEVKQKRGIQKRRNSIWGDVDLSAAMAETAKASETIDLPNGHVVDSSLRPVDAEGGSNPQAEHYMADPQEAESPQITAEVPAKPKAPEPKKKAPRTRNAKAEPKQPARRNGAKAAPAAAEAPAAAVRTGRKIYSSKERAQKLGQIEKSIGSGETLKSAARQAGISEQTYYQWKKAATPASDGGDLKDLLALEEENKRLKGLLAERLRKENAELKKKLGLA